MSRVDLPDPETPVTAMSLPRGKSTSIPLRLLADAPCHADARAGPARAAGVEVMRRPWPSIRAPVTESGCAPDVGERARGHHVAAVASGARSEVDDGVGRPDGLLVVLDDDDGVAAVAQRFQGVDQHVVVPGVQADGGLVQDVADPREVGAQLGGQAHALGLAAGKRVAAAAERQVGEPQLVQEGQPGQDLGDHGLGHGFLAKQET